MGNQQLQWWQVSNNEHDCKPEDSDLHDVGEYIPLAERRRLEREE